MAKRGKPAKGLGWRIAQARERAGLSQTALGNTTGVTRSAVSQWESEGTEPTPENLRSIALETKVSYDWLATGRGDMAAEDDLTDFPTLRGGALKVIGYVGANGATGFYDLAQDRFEVIPAGPGDPTGAVALEILGTSAGPWFDGGYVIYNDRRPMVTEDMLKKPCVVWLPDGRILLKEIRRNGGLFDLYSNDVTEPPIKGVKIKEAARVLRIIHR